MRTFSIILATALSFTGGILLGNGHITLGALSLVFGAFIFGWWAGMSAMFWYLEKEYTIIPKSKK